MRRFLILLSTLLVLVSMLVSCTSYSYRESTHTWPIVRDRPPIATTQVEVTGETEKEKLKIQFKRSDGKCKKLWVNNVEKSCREFGFFLEETYFCIPPDDDHPANSKINNVDLHCGIVHFLTDGADIQFKASSKAANRKCKKIGGKVYCF